jgi:hypothetical protein
MNKYFQMIISLLTLSINLTCLLIFKSIFIKVFFILLKGLIFSYSNALQCYVGNGGTSSTGINTTCVVGSNQFCQVRISNKNLV